MSKLEQALGHVRFQSEQGDVRGTERAFRDALKVAQAEPPGARQAAGEAIFELALSLTDALESPEPVKWGMDAAAALQTRLPAGAREALPQLRKKFRGLGDAALGAYRDALDRKAAALEATARGASAGKRPALRAEAAAAREAVWEAWRALGMTSPTVPLDRHVPARYVEDAREVVRRARAAAKSPFDTEALGGSGMPHDDVLYPLVSPHPDRPDEWRPSSLQAAVVLAALADELAQDGDAEGARWAVSLGALIASQVRTLDSMVCDVVAELVPRLVAAAQRHQAREVGKRIREMVETHDCAGELPAAAEKALAALEKELG